MNSTRTSTQPERAIALLVLATQGRMMQPEPRDVVALIDFLEEEEEGDEGIWYRRSGA